MKPDLADFVRRDWEALAGSKAAHWANRKRTHGPAEAFRVAEVLRQHVVALRPGWPTEADRFEDLATHARVAASLRLVVSARAR